MARRIPLIAFFTALSCIGAFIKIPLPFTGVFMTMQVVFVIMSGFLLGGRDGMIAQLVYLAVGLVGVPVFSKGGGFSYVMNYEFGYLLGFPVMALISGLMFYRIKRNNFISALLCGAAGLIGFYAIALVYIYGLSGIVLSGWLDMRTMLVSFCAVFLPVDALKIVLAAFLGIQIIRRVPWMREQKKPRI